MRLIHPTCDVGTLFVVCNQHCTAAIVDSILGIVVTNAADRVPSHIDVIDLGVRRDLTRQHDQAGIAQGLGGYARKRILGQNRIQNRIGDLVGDLVRVPLGDGFRGKKVVITHKFRFQSGEKGPGSRPALPRSGRRFSGICRPPRKLSIKSAASPI